MSHEITGRDGLFMVREEAWHGLGHVFENYPTRAEAQAIAHPWEPEPEPLFRQVIIPNEFGMPTTTYAEVKDYTLNVRSDDKGSLGVVTSTYEPVKNGEMYDIAEALQGGGTDVMFETGGSLRGGKNVWLLLRLNEPIVINGDPHGATIPYYALQNSHDGLGAFKGQATNVRIVCANTSKAADMDAEARGTEFSFNHTKNVRDRIEQAKEALAGWRHSVVEFQRLSEHLLTMPVSEAQRTLFLEKFVPAPPPHVASERVMANVEEARGLIRSILAGPTCEGIDGTAYGLVQASVEYLNHHRKAKSNESRFKRAYLDRNILVADATMLAQEVALVG